MLAETGREETQGGIAPVTGAEARPKKAQDSERVARLPERLERACWEVAQVEVEQGRAWAAR